MRIRPDSGARNVRAGSIIFEFNEVVSERPQGAPTLAELFVVSPSRGDLRLSWRRTRLEVFPRGGLSPNTTYIVRMLPGLVDLDNNVDSAGRTLVFSTGPDVASAHVTGQVFDWTAARAMPLAYVEAVSLPDSLRYATTTDSIGRFSLAFMQPGRYLLRALIDQNRNRRIDGRELFDSATIELRDSVRREMLAALRDSLGPGVLAVDVRDSVTLRIGLDRPLDTLFVATPASFTLKAADSSSFEIAAVVTQADLDRRIADSTARLRVQDSVRRIFREDSIRRADSARVLTPPAGPTGRRPGAQVAPPPAAREPERRPDPKPGARIPTMALFLELRRPLPAATSFRLHGADLRSITGAVRSSERLFSTPRARARPDTGAVRRDTGTVRRD